jgi:hypothetical protein
VSSWWYSGLVICWEVMFVVEYKSYIMGDLGNFTDFVTDLNNNFTTEEIW